MIKLYNTLTRKLEEFIPINDKKVGIYSCGPTVYWNQHIGNMYAYVQWDSLVRLLRYLGFDVTWVMNITDVGHLTSDEDAGVDKMEKGAQREGVSVWDIADKYIAQFKENLKLLNIQTPDRLPRATEHIPDQIDLIKRIEANGFTYKTKTGLVFDTAKFPGYADFAKLNLKEQQSGSRVEVDPEKKSPWDFLLWVTNQPTHIMQWDSPWGKGFPGWHIECTAMSTKYLGDQFDIHTGGIEHIPVHHTNEIAQGCGAFNHQTARFWLHNQWLLIDGQKVSKSLGNTVLVTDLVNQGFNPLGFRYLVLTSHYRQGLNFTKAGMEASQSALSRLCELIGQWKKEDKRNAIGEEGMKKVDTYRQEFLDAVTDDLNFASGIATLWRVAKSNIPSRDKLDLILEFDQVLGLKLAACEKADVSVPEEVKQLVADREEARNLKQWEQADQIRQKIESLGWQIEDTSSGTLVKKL